MKSLFKKIVTKVANRILKYSEQYSLEKIYSDFNLDKSIRIYNVSLEGNIKIGEHTYINERSRIDSGQHSRVEIGKHCAIGRNVHITAKTHELSQPTSVDIKLTIPHIEEDVIIGDYVWIGDNVVIKPGIIIKDHAIIGANSVVSKNVNDFEIVGGVPAKHIRFNEEHHLYIVKHKTKK